MHDGKRSIRSFAIKGLSAFAGVNLLALPFCVIFFVCAPQKIELDVVAESGVSIALSDTKFEDGTINYCSAVELYDRVSDDCSGHVFNGQFPRAFDFSAPALYIRSDTNANVMIGSMRKIVGVFRKTLSPAEFAAAYCVDGAVQPVMATNGMVKVQLTNGSCRVTPVGEPSWGRWEMAFESENTLLSRIGMFLLVQFCLMCAMFFVVFLRRHIQEKAFHVWQSVALSAITTYFICYVVPLQSYFANVTDYPFCAVQLVIDIIPFSLAVALPVLVGLLLTQRAFGRLIHFAVFSLLVYEYLEVGLLSRGAPGILSLDYYANLELEQRDWLVLSYAFIFVMVPYTMLKKYFSWMLAAIFVMFSASLLDVIVGQSIQKVDRQSTRFDCSADEVPLVACYSSKRNVIVFVLDSVTSEVAKDVVSSQDGFVEQFEGFIAYDRNLGVHYHTDLSTANIFTGRIYRGNADPVREHEFLAKATSSDSLLWDFLNSTSLVYCMPPKKVFGHGYVSGFSGQRINAVTKQVVKSPLFWRSHGVFSTSVLNLSLFRMTPFGLKCWMYRWSSPYFGFAEESYIYPYFRAAPVVDAEGCFLYCHTHGAHIPHDVSSDGLRHGILMTTYAANFDHTKAIFVELGKTLDAFRRKGIYDCSTIIVIADHGAHCGADAKHVDNREGALPTCAFPMLWVKPANSHGPIVFDDVAPTTHANLYKALRTLKDRDLTSDELTAMLSSGRRQFFMPTLDRQGYYQWEVSADGSIRSFERINDP